MNAALKWNLISVEHFRTRIGVGAGLADRLMRILGPQNTTDKILDLRRR